MKERFIAGVKMNKNNVEIKNNVFIKRADYEKYQLVPLQIFVWQKKTTFHLFRT